MILASAVLAAAAWSWDGGDQAPRSAEVPIGIEALVEGQFGDPRNVVPDEAPVAVDPSLPAPKDEPKIRVRILGGAVSGLITGGEPQIEPMARIDVGWGVIGGKRPVTASVIADLTALPGDAVNLADVASFRALKFSLAGSWKVFPQIAASAYARGSFASRYETRGDVPVTEAPKSADFGVRFSTEERHAFLEVGMGPTQFLDGSWVAAVSIRGSLDLYEAEMGSRLEGTSIALTVDATLGLEHSYTVSTRRDMVTVGAVLGWGK